MRICLIVLAILLLIVSLLMIAYPVFSSWYTARIHSGVRTEYQKKVEQTDRSELEAAWEAAREYNRKLYYNEIQPHDDLNETGYYNLLNPTRNGVMGYIEIPKIDVSLPIYHNVTEDVLLKGAGHMPQTSLPIGGENTHAAISAHTGLASAPMFTELVQLVVGDLFYINVLGEKLAYEVGEILVVEPDDIEHIQPQPGQDLVTLVTCTPYGVNTHRLLVRGSRVPYSEELAVEQQSLSQQTDTPSVYWQRYMGGILDGLLIVVAAVALPGMILLLRSILRKQKRKELVPC